MINDRKNKINSDICGDIYIPADACDCKGSVIDCMGVCGGTVVLDCSGECGGSLTIDECRVCGGKGKVRCWNGRYLCREEECPSDPHKNTRNSSAAVSSHPNNPGSLRYWKNIIPDYYKQDDRIGIGSLIDIEETLEDGEIDILFGFGSIGYDSINIDGETDANGKLVYYNYIELWASWRDEISEIRFKLDGIDLPEIDNSYDTDFGITEDDGTPDYTTSVTITNNEVTLLADEDSRICGTSNVTNKLLIKIPFISRSANVCFDYMSEGSKIYVRSDDKEYTSYEQFPYWIFESQGPFMKNCQEPFYGIFIYEDYTQEWVGYCENSDYDNKVDCEFNSAKWITPYYPVLPKYNKYGKMDNKNNNEWEFGLGLQNNNIPFGSTQREWNEDDPLALATLTTLPKAWSKNCLIDLDFSAIEDNTLNDVGPVTNLGILLDDYKVHFDPETIKPFAKKINSKSKLSKVNKDKPF